MSQKGRPSRRWTGSAFQRDSIIVGSWTPSNAKYVLSQFFLSGGRPVLGFVSIQNSGLNRQARSPAFPRCLRGYHMSFAERDLPAASPRCEARRVAANTVLQE